jgi:ribonuclease HII
MPRSKRFDYYLDEVDWSYGHGYRIRIPYVDEHGRKRIHFQTFSVQKLWLSIPAAKRVAKTERDRLMQVLDASPPKKKKARPPQLHLK